MKIWETPNQRTHYGFCVTEPGYRKHFAERGDPIAWWQQECPELPLLTAMARYVKERASAPDAAA